MKNFAYDHPVASGTVLGTAPVLGLATVLNSANKKKTEEPKTS